MTQPTNPTSPTDKTPMALISLYVATLDLRTRLNEARQFLTDLQYPLAASIPDLGSSPILEDFNHELCKHIETLDLIDSALDSVSRIIAVLHDSGPTNNPRPEPCKTMS